MPHQIYMALFFSLGKHKSIVYGNKVIASGCKKKKKKRRLCADAKKKKRASLKNKFQNNKPKSLFFIRV